MTLDKQLCQGLLNHENKQFLSVFYTNADCLSQSKKEELELYINSNSPDIIGVTEMFPKRSSFKNQEIFYQLTDYDFFFKQS